MNRKIFLRTTTGGSILVHRQKHRLPVQDDHVIEPTSNFSSPSLYENPISTNNKYNKLNEQIENIKKNSNNLEKKLKPANINFLL